MTDIEILLENVFPFVKEMLKTYGEFFPVAAAIKTDGSLVMVELYDGDERPASNELIKGLKDALRKDAEIYRAITIFYDVVVSNQDIGGKTDAIAVCTEVRNDSIAYTYFYPYQITPEDILLDTNTWKEEKNKEVFIA